MIGSTIYDFEEEALHDRKEMSGFLGVLMKTCAISQASVETFLLRSMRVVPVDEALCSQDSSDYYQEEINPDNFHMYLDGIHGRRGLAPGWRNWKNMRFDGDPGTCFDDWK